MGLFGRKQKGGRDERPAQGRRPKAGQPKTRPAGEPCAFETVESDDDQPLSCVSCGRELGFDPEDEPDGDGPGRHLCGECNRARNFDADVEMMWFNGDL